ncbi:hypothetical protein [uncultured Cellulomonas sp.]|uniref:hypothetical protein n=1 Tax=uncultured Cellulomonas sp. TaxID=189682 RepID=UPI00262667EA|nr:hypothetical protein [uncultured Cellulomonas sp.]
MRPADGVPALTACRLCAGESLGEPGDVPGGQLDRLRAIESRGAARLALVECLDECDRGDVVVVRPSPAGRRADGRPVWFERLAGDGPTAELAGWLDRGGPGHAPVPTVLTDRVIRRRD